MGTVEVIRMYQVMEMYGDNEPWWFFEGWEEDISHEEVFEELEPAIHYYEKKYQQLAQEYSMMKTKDRYLTAFWKDGDFRFCEECDDDLQQYKGLVLLKNCHPLIKNGKEQHETISYSGKTKCCKRLGQSARSQHEA